MPDPRRVPTRLKILAGNPGKKPLPVGEPMPEPSLPSPPSHLDAYALEEWNRVAPGLYALKILSEVDRASLGAYCDSYSTWRNATEELNKLKDKNSLAALITQTIQGNYIVNPLVGIANKAKADMMHYANEFGMSPSARARMGVIPKKGEKSKFDGLVGLEGGKKDSIKSK
jgi:P27 family predicted phage terminase small subunit